MMMHRIWACFLTLLLLTPVLAKDPLPEWTKGAVWYQILPERFRNVNPANDPLKQQVVGKEVKDWQVHPWASDWYKLQIWEVERGLDFDELIWQRRYGGDLLGVIEKLRYLKELGVDVIYLNPVFESPSIEKFDAATFHHIDDNFGLDRDGDREKIENEKEDAKTWTLTKADDAFLQLISEAHKLEMKVVIDAVFHYCGREFWAFKDLLEKQQKSAYQDWFEVLSWDDPATPDTVEFSYKCWQNDTRLPLFKKDENGPVEPVKKYLFDITRRWLDPNSDGSPVDGIDGWVIHDAQELGASFVVEWGKLVKSINPLALTVADGKETPDGNPFDLTANYELAPLMQGFFLAKDSKLSVSQFNAHLQHWRKALPQSVHSGFNRLSDYKKERIATVIRNSSASTWSGGSMGNGHDYDPRKPDKENIQSQKLLTIFQLTSPGAPVILFGDESGMWGGGYRDVLKPMLWREFVYEKESYSTIRPDLKDEIPNVFDAELFDLYRRLNKIRHANPAIQKGDFQTILVDDEKGLFAFSRRFDKNEVIVILNNSDQQQEIELAIAWNNKNKVKDVLNEKKYLLVDGKVKLSLEKKWGAILVKLK